MFKKENLYYFLVSLCIILGVSISVVIISLIIYAFTPLAFMYCLLIGLVFTLSSIYGVYRKIVQEVKEIGEIDITTEEIEDDIH